MKIIITTKRKDEGTKKILKSFGVSDDLIETYDSISFEFDSTDLKVEDRKGKEVTDKLSKLLKD